MSTRIEELSAVITTPVHRTSGVFEVCVAFVWDKSVPGWQATDVYPPEGRRLRHDERAAAVLRAIEHLDCAIIAAAGSSGESGGTR